MQLSPHFTLAEFEVSETASRRGISNRVPADLMQNLHVTAACLERVRAALGGYPVVITSGYRTEEVNRRVGGGKGSHHLLASAADFIVPGFGSPLDVCRELAPLVDELKIGQLIAEYADESGSGWVHVSVLAVSRTNRIITIDRGSPKTRQGIHPARPAI